MMAGSYFFKRFVSIRHPDGETKGMMIGHEIPAVTIAVAAVVVFSVVFLISLWAESRSPWPGFRTP